MEERCSTTTPSPLSTEGQFSLHGCWCFARCSNKRHMGKVSLHAQCCSSMVLLISVEENTFCTFTSYFPLVCPTSYIPYSRNVVIHSSPYSAMITAPAKGLMGVCGCGSVPFRKQTPRKIYELPFPSLSGDQGLL